MIERPVALYGIDGRAQEDAATELNCALKNLARVSVHQINGAFTIDQKPLSFAIDYRPAIKGSIVGNHRTQSFGKRSPHDTQLKVSPGGEKFPVLEAWNAPANRSWTTPRVSAAIGRPHARPRIARDRRRCRISKYPVAKPRGLAL